MKSQLREIRAYLTKHWRFRLVHADPDGDAIALTGLVGQRRHKKQAFRYSQHWWRPIVDQIDVARTWFLVGSLAKHILVFVIIAEIFRRLAIEIEWLRILDEAGLFVMAFIVSLFFVWELIEEFVHAVRE